MRKIYIIVGGLLLLVGIFFMHAVDIAAGLLTLIAATQGIGRMRKFGKTLGFMLGALALVEAVEPDLLGAIGVTSRNALVHGAAALVYLYVGLLAPPKL